jgi:hypothetical protein
MNTTETDLSAPPTPPAERPHADRGEWGRVRIPGGQQGRPHTHPANQPPSSDDAVELDAFDDFDAYDQTTSG